MSYCHSNRQAVIASDCNFNLNLVVSNFNIALLNVCLLCLSWRANQVCGR